MHGLEVPLVFPGFRVDGDDGIREQVVARAIAAPVVRGRSGDGHIEDAALDVRGHVPAPDVHARAPLPAVVLPRVVAALAGARHGVKLPELLAGTRVVRRRVAGRADRHLAHRRAQRNHVLEDDRHAVPSDGDVGDAVPAEAFGRLARGRVERHQPRRRVRRARVEAAASGFHVRRARGENDPLGVVAVAGPVRDAAARRVAVRDLIAPDLLAGGRVEREDVIAAGVQIHHAVDDDRRHLGIREDLRRSRTASARAGRGCGLLARRRGAGAAGAASLSGRTLDQRDVPGRRQLRHVVGVDLRERRILRARQIARIHRPVAVGRFLGPNGNREQGDGQGRGHESKSAKAHGIPPGRIILRGRL